MSSDDDTSVSVNSRVPLSKLKDADPLELLEELGCADASPSQQRSRKQKRRQCPSAQQTAVQPPSCANRLLATALGIVQGLVFGLLTIGAVVAIAVFGLDPPP
eukprot:2451039-Prymnesium_polylepis.1